MISPIGGTTSTEEESEKQLQLMLNSKNIKWYQKYFIKKFKTIFEKEQGPTKLLNTWYIPSNTAIKRYFSKRIGLPEKEVNLFKEYFHSVY